MDERGMNNDVAAADPDTARRTEEIRSEIEQTREEMAETIDAIEEKLRPRNIVASATERVKTATTERMRAMAGSAGETAQTVMNRAGETAQTMVTRTRDTAGGLFEIIRDNPYPAALIGAGVAWMLFSANRDRDPDWDSIRGDSPRRRFLGGRDWSYDSETAYGAYGGSSGRYGYRGWQERDRSMADDSLTGDDAGGYGSRVADAAQDVADSARAYAGDASAALRRGGRRAQNQFERMMTENPLLVGAGALLLGAAFGLAVPETDRENEWMGEARDQVVDRAQQMAGDAATRLKQTAEQVADAAGNVADSVTPNKA